MMAQNHWLRGRVWGKNARDHSTDCIIRTCAQKWKEWNAGIMKSSAEHHRMTREEGITGFLIGTSSEYQPPSKLFLFQTVRCDTTHEDQAKN
jgi:hypothetical protein